MYTSCFASQPFMLATNKSNSIVKLGILPQHTATRMYSNGCFTLISFGLNRPYFAIAPQAVFK